LPGYPPFSSGPIDDPKIHQVPVFGFEGIPEVKSPGILSRPFDSIGCFFKKE
jgi:hypothetical protein